MIKAYRNLAIQVWMQSIHDYISYPFPSSQRNKELRIAFNTASRFIWLDDFYMENFFGEDLEPLHISDFLKLVADRHNIKTDKMRAYAKNELYTKTKDIKMPTKQLPHVILLDAEPYWVKNKPSSDITKNREIILSSLSNRDDTWKELMRKSLDIFVERKDISVTPKELQELSEFMYYFIKFNEAAKAVEE